MATIARRAYAEMFGPTVGDRLRLADTDLILEGEQDLTLRSLAPVWSRAAGGAIALLGLGLLARMVVA